jgi:hypothetical protein
MYKNIKISYYLFFITTIIIILLFYGCGNVHDSDKEGERNMEEFQLVDYYVWQNSPSGRYGAILRNVENPSAKTYTVIIRDNDTKEEFPTNFTFRKRDNNFVVWADDEDILWGYNGDIGTYFWTLDDDGVWQENSYASNKDADVPTALLKLRPRYFR